MGKELSIALANKEIISGPRSEKILSPLRKETSIGKFLDKVNSLAINRYFHNKIPNF
ncbi:MAG: hypothetical protein AAB569_00730 [Patescibacteria group bacterium]